MSRRASCPDQRRGLAERGLAQEPIPQSFAIAAEIAACAENDAIGVQV